MELSDFVPVLTSIITAAGGVIGTLFAVSLRSRHQARRDEEQALAEERDAAAATLRAEVERSDTNRHFWKLWKNEYYYLRAWILQQGLTNEQLRDMPRPPEHR